MVPPNLGIGSDVSFRVNGIPVVGKVVGCDKETHNALQLTLETEAIIPIRARLSLDSYSHCKVVKSYPLLNHKKGLILCVS